MALHLCQCLEGHIPNDVDWTALATLSNRTLVTPALAHAIGCNEALPREMRDLLNAIQSRTGERNRRLYIQLVESVEALVQSGITPIVFKGAAILARHGASFDQRLSADLDLMVPGEQREIAVRALQAIGYGMNAWPGSEYLGIDFSRPDDVGTLDLHFALKLRYAGFSPTDLRKHCELGAIGAVEVWLPTPTLQATLLLLHDQIQERDYWRGGIDLRHALDLRDLLRAEPGKDVQDWMRLLPKGQPRRAAEVQLRTVSELFNLPILHSTSWSVGANIQHRRRMAQLRHPRIAKPMTLATLLADPPFHLLWAARSGIDTPPSFRKRAQILRRMFVPPKDAKL